ncbi:SIS domain-containing protein [Oceanospirillaceae bacterium]|nr:SIS domain-containing protein [Oceanospirillaceae bacterium]
MNSLDRIYENSNSKESFATAYMKYLSSVLENISTKEISNFIDVLLSARERGSSIYFIGNGGSAATASHFANDIGIGTRTYKKPFRTVSLCDNQAVITAIGNDDGYEKIFSQQLNVLLKKNDVVVAISASGNSPNLICAVDMAKQKNAITVGLTSFDGGKLREKADISVHVPTDKGEYGPAEDAHMVLDHLVGSYLMRLVKDNEND